MLNVALGELESERVQKPSERAPHLVRPDRENPPERENLHHAVEKAERTHILRILEACNGLVSGPNGAAARLGIGRSTLQLRMQKLGIRRAQRFVDRG